MFIILELASKLYENLNFYQLFYFSYAVITAGVDENELSIFRLGFIITIILLVHGYFQNCFFTLKSDQ